MGRLKEVNGMDIERLFVDELTSQIDREILKKLWESVSFKEIEIEDDDSQFEFGFE